MIDTKRFIAFGFSRFGKTALWAAAQDQRFALVLSNESGQARATLSHRKQGEPIDHMMLAFPYWFCGNYQHYLVSTQTLPVSIANPPFGDAVLPRTAEVGPLEFYSRNFGWCRRPPH